MAELFGSNASSPKGIAELVENLGVAKARLPLLSMCLLLAALVYLLIYRRPAVKS